MIGPDTLVFFGATLLGASLGLVHLALAIRAFHQGWRRGLLSLLVPPVGAVFAAQTGARGAAITWGLLGVGYAVLLLVSLR